MAAPPALPWRVVWITGASTGIGAEIARQLAARGITVAVSARSADRLSALAKDNARLKPYPLDVTDARAVAATYAAIGRDLGAVDLVLAAAGTYAPLTLDAFSPAPFRSMYETNYLGVIHVLSAVLPDLRARRSGHVAWIASVAGYRGLPKAAAYGPTKAALINLAETLYLDLRDAGIGVSLINPGFVETPLTQQNAFTMPALITPEQAAIEILRGWARGRFDIHFPKRFTRWLKLLRLLPYRLYFAAVSRFTGL